MGYIDRLWVYGPEEVLKAVYKGEHDYFYDESDPDLLAEGLRDAVMEVIPSNDSIFMGSKRLSPAENCLKLEASGDARGPLEEIAAAHPRRSSPSSMPMNMRRTVRAGTS